MFMSQVQPVVNFMGHRSELDDAYPQGHLLFHEVFLATIHRVQARHTIRMGVDKRISGHQRNALGHDACLDQQ